MSDDDGNSGKSQPAQRERTDNPQSSSSQSGRRVAILRRLVDEHGTWVTIAFAILVFGGLLVLTDTGAVIDAFREFNPWAFGAVLGLTTFGYLFRFGKWEFYLRELDINVPVRRSLIVFFSGLMMVVTPGKAGEVWKAWLLRDMEDIPASRTTSVVGAERVTDLLSLSILAAIGVVIYGYSSMILVGLVIVIVIGFALLQWRSGCLRLLKWAESVPLIGNHAESLETFYESSYDLFQIRPLVISTGLSVIAWGLEGVALWFVLKGFGVETTILVGLFVFALGSVVGAVSMLPGGVGTAEATMTALLLTFGVAESVAAATTILIRVGTLWYAALLGLAVFSLYKVLGTGHTRNSIS